MPFLSPFSRKVNNTTNIQQDFYEDHNETGVEGENNYTLGAGSADLSTSLGASIAGDENFAPVFSFGDNGGASAARQAYNQAVGDTGPGDQTFLDWWAANGDSSGPNSLANNPYDAALLSALAPSNAQAADILTRLGGSGSGTDNSSTQVGGAVQGSGTVAGEVNAPIASGDDSIAVGNVVGPVVLGDFEGFQNTGTVNAPVTVGDFSGAQVTAPITGSAIITGGDAENITMIDGGNDAPIASGPDSTAIGVTAPTGIVSAGDVESSGPIITGNTGPVNIETADPELLTEALSSNADVLDSALEYGRQALGIVAESRKDPNERVTSDIIGEFKWLILGVAALAYFSNR